MLLVVCFCCFWIGVCSVLLVICGWLLSSVGCCLLVVATRSLSALRCLLFVGWLWFGVCCVSVCLCLSLLLCFCLLLVVCCCALVVSCVLPFFLVG